MAEYVYARFRVFDDQEIRLADIILLIFERKADPECPLGRVFFPAVSHMCDFIRNRLAFGIYKTNQIRSFFDSLPDRFRLDEIQRRMRLVILLMVLMKRIFTVRTSALPRSIWTSMTGTSISCGKNHRVHNSDRRCPAF